MESNFTDESREQFVKFMEATAEGVGALTLLFLIQGSQTGTPSFSVVEAGSNFVNAVREFQTQALIFIDKEIEKSKGKPTEESEIEDLRKLFGG